MKSMKPHGAAVMKTAPEPEKYDWVTVGDPDTVEHVQFRMIDATDPVAMGEALLEVVRAEEARRGAAISHIIIDEHGLRFRMPIEREEELEP